MEEKHRHHPIKGTLLKTAKIKGPYRRSERVIKDDLLLEKLRNYTHTGSAQGDFQFERNEEQENLLKKFQDGNLFLCLLEFKTMYKKS